MRDFNQQDLNLLLSDPLRFMDSVCCAIGGNIDKPRVLGKPDELTFKADKMRKAYKLVDLGNDFGMQEVPLFKLQRATSNDTLKFKAYIIEYKAGTTPISILGQDATLAFTANMNGCTLGIGSQSNATASLVVTHSNSKGHGSNQGNYQDQAMKASHVVGPGGKLFEPEHYRSDGKQSITFGVRSPGKKWGFYFLSYKMTPGMSMSNYRHLGVKPVSTNSVSL